MSWLDPITPDPGAGTIAAELVALVNEFRAAGVPATADPDLILPLLAELGAGVLVSAPKTELPYLSGVQVQATVTVYLAGNPPAGWAQWVPIWNALPVAMRTVGAGIAEPVELTVANVSLPAMRLTTQRTFQATELTLLGAR
jgi:hypothetical protein